MVRSISKNRIVRSLFTKLAPFFDAFEPALTWGRGNAWRRKMAEYSGLDKPQRVLDACAGTGLLSTQLANHFGPHSHVVAVDFCPNMVAVAKQRLRVSHLQRRVEFKVENVEIMPFPDGFFDGVFLAFGLRFVSDIRTVLRECHRVLKPGAPMVILDLAVPSNPMKPLVHFYREYGVPIWNRARHQLPSSFTHYLHDSLVHYPDADKLGRMLLRAGYNQVQYRTLGLGTVTLHKAMKIEDKHAPQPVLFNMEPREKLE